MLPRKTPRCRQRRNPTRATSVPTRRIPTVHREVRTVLTPTISVVSQSVRIWTMPRSTAAFHRSKPEASACEARTRPTIATRTVARATQTLPLTPRLRGRGGGSPEGRRRRPRPPGPRCGAMLRLGEVPAASVAMADATAAVQARDTAISALIPPSGLQAGPAVALGALEHQYNTGKVESLDGYLLHRRTTPLPAQSQQVTLPRRALVPEREDHRPDDPAGTAASGARIARDYSR